MKSKKGYVTNDEIRIAIAESCGWKWEKRCDEDGMEPLWNPKGEWVGSFIHFEQGLPNYPEDLNAMHEVEGTLSEDEQERMMEHLHYIQRDEWSKRMLKTTDAFEWFICHATARQRGEAYLRVKALWKMNKPKTAEQWAQYVPTSGPSHINGRISHERNKAMKTTVIHHSADFDGLFCRAIARKFLPDTELIGWDYGDPALEFPKEGTIYVLDLSPDCFWESPLRAEYIGRLVWIDHHKTAIEKYDGSGWEHEPAGKDSFGVAYKEFWRKGHETRTTPPSPAIVGYRIDGVAACRLAWQWFTDPTHTEKTAYGDLLEVHELPSKEMFIERRVNEPLAVRLAGEYDIFDKRDPRAEMFQHGLRSRDLDGWWDALLSNEAKASVLEVESMIDAGRTFELCPNGNIKVPGLGDRVVENLLKRGEAIQYSKTNEYRATILSAGFTIQWEGFTFLACNNSRESMRSQLFAAGLKPEHDGCLGFSWKRDQWVVSLYNDKGKDFTPIAKKYGGGGHPGACGFQCKTLPFALS